MNNFNGNKHIWKSSTSPPSIDMNCSCSVCGYNKYVCDFYGCEEIQRKVSSHTWENIKYNLTVRCTICSLYGSLDINNHILCYNYKYGLLSCNEFLMIKANE